MAILKYIIILMVAVSCTHSLVSWEKYPATNITESCALPDGRTLEMYQHVNHLEMCAEIMCWDTDGTTIIMYCQITVPFQECNETGVDTYSLFPECCYQCVYYTDC